MKKNKKNEKGAIIVEASIVLPIFMFAIVAVLSIINFCTAQAKIQIAINNTAKEISQYSYLYSLTGLNKFQSDAHDKGEASASKVNNVIGDVQSIYSALDDTAKDPTNLDAVMNNLDSVKNDADSINAVVNQISDDPKGFILGFAYALADEGMEQVKSYVAVPMAKMFCKKHLTSGNLDTEQYLKKLGIVPRGGSYYDGIDFSSSRLFPHGNDNSIIIVAKYEMKIINVFGLEIKYNFVQSASTLGWCTSSDPARLDK